jgi:hypothetical protein
VDSGERIMLNSALYPTGAPITPSKKAAGAASEPIDAGDLPSVGNRPVAKTGPAADTLVIQVDDSDGAALRRAVRTVGAPAGKFVAGGGQVAYQVKGARQLDVEDSPAPWARKIMKRLYTKGVVPSAATL